MSKIVDLTDLEFAYNHKYLNEYLRDLEDESLVKLRNIIYVEDYEFEKAGILNALDDELEFRCLNIFIPEKDSKFLSDKFNLKMNETSIAEISRSVELLNALNIPISIVKWVPSFLYLDKAFDVYVYLKQMNRSEEEIAKVFLTSFDTFMKISERIGHRLGNEAAYEEFCLYISFLSNLVSKKKSLTEGYQKYTSDFLDRNQELLKRLM